MKLRFAVLLLLIVIPVYATTFEYAKESDLKGLTTYYVDSGADVNTRNAVVSRLENLSTSLHVADSGKAQIIIIVTGDDDEGAKFLVVIGGTDPEHPRAVAELRYSHSKFPNLRPTARFARDFMKIYANAQRSS